MSSDFSSNPKAWVEIIGARQHNLKNVSVRFPKSAFSVVTGPSGSGKSSLAFNTLFAEGQRRYMESLSTYARQFLEKQEKPDVDEIRNIAPTIAIEQKNQTKNSRSTVGTATEVYDFLRLLFARLGTMYDPKTGEAVKKDRIPEIVDALYKIYADHRVYVTFPMEFTSKSKVSDRRLVLSNLLERGFTKAFVPEKEVVIGNSIEFLDIQEEVSKKTSTLFGKAGKDQRMYVMADRLVVTDDVRSRLADALIHAYQEGQGRSRVYVLDDENHIKFIGRYTEYPSTGDGSQRYPELSPLIFSFNSPIGACENCKGFGNILRVDKNLVIPNENISIAQGAIEPLTKPSAKDSLKQLLIFCQNNRIPISHPWKSLKESDRDKIWSGVGDFPGVEGFFEELESIKYKMQVRVFLSRYRSPRMCKACGGMRLRPEARSVLFHGKSIGELSAMTIGDLQKWFLNIPLTAHEKIASKEIFTNVNSRLEFLLRVGLEYLRLDRLAKTLSGGEAQRIALANQLGSRLTQTCYVLDEPSIGLHPRDTERLIAILKDLASLKNTVVVVEHDPDIIKNADYLVDMGPDAGENGGTVLFQGAYQNFLLANPANSSTNLFLTHREFTPVPMRRRTERFGDRKKSLHWLEMTDLAGHNLKKVDLKIPLGMLTCITGVSGSGKSTAMRRTLYPALAKIFLQDNEEVCPFGKISGFEFVRSVQLIDQSPFMRSSRSNPVSFMKVYDEVRALFAATFEARKKRFHAGHFSFNVPGGRCETCEGDGYTVVEMVFMEDLYLKCEACNGKRFKKEILDIQYNGKNIDDVLNTTVTEGRKFFHSEKRLYTALGILEQVGLGYLRLGQPSNTLSGGESQRLKIARELSQSDTHGVIYILDEPTTGLHFRDVKILIRVLNELVEKGNTVVVIEHNVDVMKCSDWIIDFGPEGGAAGGDIIAEGSPEDIVQQAKGYTWKYLKEALDISPKADVNTMMGVHDKSDKDVTT